MTEEMQTEIEKRIEETAIEIEKQAFLMAPYKETDLSDAFRAGREKLKGYTDRQIRKRFMIEFGEGITVMLSMPRKDMIEFNELIKKGM